MFSCYTHLHATDSKYTMLAIAGVQKTKEKEKSLEVLKPKKCLNCNEMNSATMLYCGKCGFVLSEEEAKKQVAKQKLMDQMLEYFKEKMHSDKKLGLRTEKKLEK